MHFLISISNFFFKVQDTDTFSFLKLAKYRVIKTVKIHLVHSLKSSEDSYSFSGELHTSPFSQPKSSLYWQEVSHITQPRHTREPSECVSKERIAEHSPHVHTSLCTKQGTNSPFFLKVSCSPHTH